MEWKDFHALHNGSLAEYPAKYLLSDYHDHSFAMITSNFLEESSVAFGEREHFLGGIYFSSVFKIEDTVVEEERTAKSWPLERGHVS